MIVKLLEWIVRNVKNVGLVISVRSCPKCEKIRIDQTQTTSGLLRK